MCRAFIRGRCLKSNDVTLPAGDPMRCTETDDKPKNEIMCCSVLKPDDPLYHKGFTKCRSLAYGKECGGWSRFPPKVGSVFPQKYFVVFGGILKYPIRDRYRCVSKRPSKYTQIHAKYRSKKKPSIDQVSVRRYQSHRYRYRNTCVQVSIRRYL